MALSDDEQRRLSELETYTRSADPGFADSLGPAAADRWHQRRLARAWTASLLGIMAMMAGMGAAQGLISTGTIIASYGFLLTLWGVGATIRIIRTPITEIGRTREHS